MHSTCSNDMPPLPLGVGCGPALSHSFEGTYYPSPSAAAALEQLANDPYRAELEQVDAALAARPAEGQQMRLMVGSAGLAAAVVRHLALLTVHDVEVQVAGQPAPAYKPEYWTPAMAEAKAAAWDAQQPRHSSAFTKSQPSPKARKAARRRARAGRKASR
jgi:hypothetical protein